MFLVRPAEMEDVDAIVQLARLSEPGLTTLPKDRSLLEERVRRSCEGFARHVDKPAGESYLLVGEELATGRIVGTSSIVSRVGGFEPFYAYELRTEVHASKQLGIRREIPTLFLLAQHDGPSEIGTLFVDPQCRGGGLGSLLSKSRFLLLAEYPHAFASPVIAEMRGVSDADGRPPFWEAVGRHFFEIDFAHADYLSVRDKRFIAELMPTYPIYIPLLRPDGQRAIGQVHEKTRPALAILRQEGFVPSGKVDIFDAGPILVCPLDQIRSVRDSKRRSVRVADRVPEGAPTCVIARAGGDRGSFRACAARVVESGDDRLTIEGNAAAALGVGSGDHVRYVARRAHEPRGESP